MELPGPDITWLEVSLCSPKAEDEDRLGKATAC